MKWGIYLLIFLNLAIALLSFLGSSCRVSTLVIFLDFGQLIGLAYFVDTPYALNLFALLKEMLILFNPLLYFSQQPGIQFLRNSPYFTSMSTQTTETYTYHKLKLFYNTTSLYYNCVYLIALQCALLLLSRLARRKLQRRTDQAQHLDQRGRAQACNRFLRIAAQASALAFYVTFYDLALSLGLSMLSFGNILNTLLFVVVVVLLSVIIIKEMFTLLFQPSDLPSLEEGAPQTDKAGWQNILSSEYFVISVIRKLMVVFALVYYYSQPKVVTLTIAGTSFLMLLVSFFIRCDQHTRPVNAYQRATQILTRLFETVLFLAIYMHILMPGASQALQQTAFIVVVFYFFIITMFNCFCYIRDQQAAGSLS